MLQTFTLLYKEVGDGQHMALITWACERIREKTELRPSNGPGDYFVENFVGCLTILTK